MASIDPANQLAALIRAQIGAQFRAQAQKAGDARVGRQTAGHRSTARPGTPAEQTHSLQALVALQVSALSPDDPERPRRAFRVFLEAILMQEFGRERANDPAFHTLINQVLSQMEGDEALNAALLEAGELLVAEAPPPHPGG